MYFLQTLGRLCFFLSLPHFLCHSKEGEGQFMVQGQTSFRAGSSRKGMGGGSFLNEFSRIDNVFTRSENGASLFPAECECFGLTDPPHTLQQ